MQRRDNQGGRLLMRTPARPRLPDGDCVFISGAPIVARANAPRHRCRHGATGIAPRRICVHTAFSISKLKNNSSFETEKESLSEIRHQLRIDAREGARAASVHQGCIPEGPHHPQPHRNSICCSRVNNSASWNRCRPRPIPLMLVCWLGAKAHLGYAEGHLILPQHDRKLPCATTAGMCGLRSQ